MTITTNSVITQQQQQVNHLSVGDTKRNSKQPKNTSCLPDVLVLSLRGVSMTITRDTLVSLPESILIAMLAQGFITSENDICHINFDYEALIYILYQFRCAKNEKHFNDDEEKAVYHARMPLDPLLTKQGMIVLREELQYFIVVITETSALINLKKKCTETLIKQGKIFDSLIESVALKETSGLFTDAVNAEAEHQLFDLLCLAGFTKQDQWGYRWMEPNKTCISSLSVVAIQHHHRLPVGQKLMVFWRKPARKCWWSKSIMKMDNESVKLWCRRTWTLEFSLI